MRISELVEKLEDIRAEKGDIDVGLEVDYEGADIKKVITEPTVDAKSTVVTIIG